MLKKIIKGYLASYGYEIRKSPSDRDKRLGYMLHEYVKDDGSFDYEKYRQIQTEGNRSKIEMVWVNERNIIFLSNYIRNMIGQPRFGICHGTRRGKEQEWFRKHLGCEVIGTEISDTAEHFPHTIQWDFHQIKPEWIEACDFIYSNAFDHSYDPEKCLDAWMGCLRKEGLCIIEHSSGHGPKWVTELDPFGADIVLMPYLITRWAKGKYGVREIINAPDKKAHDTYSKFIVIQKF
jgi:hypothetical protein